MQYTLFHVNMLMILHVYISILWYMDVFYIILLPICITLVLSAQCDRALVCVQSRKATHHNGMRHAILVACLVSKCGCCLGYTCIVVPMPPDPVRVRVRNAMQYTNFTCGVRCCQPAPVQYSHQAAAWQTTQIVHCSCCRSSSPHTSWF